MSRVAGALLGVLVLASTLRADVIPSQYSDGEAAKAREVVSGRYQALGFSPGEASHRVKMLLDEDARFFAANPERVQLVGDEGDQGVVIALIEGGVLLAGVAAFGIYRWHVEGK